MKGKCPQGHKVGETWTIGARTPSGMCVSAFGALMPYLNVMRYCAKDGYPWGTDPDETDVGCSDPVNQVVFRLRRIRDK